MTRIEAAIMRKGTGAEVKLSFKPMQCGCFMWSQLVSKAIETCRRILNLYGDFEVELCPLGGLMRRPWVKPSCEGQA